MNIVCVDFDGTMVDHRFPDIGPEVPGAVNWMIRWQEEGVSIILHTMRSNGQESGDVLNQAVDWIEGHGIRLMGANENPTQFIWTTSPKPYGQIYVDDAAYGCPLIHPEGFARPCVDWRYVGPGVFGKFGIKYKWPEPPKETQPPADTG